MKMIKRKRSKEVTVRNKFTGEEKVFNTVGEASEFLGCSRVHLSGIISGKRKKQNGIHLLDRLKNRLQNMVTENKTCNFFNSTKGLRGYKKVMSSNK